MSVRPAGFMSYVRSDDANDNGRISELRKRLEGEIRVQSGDNTFHIFRSGLRFAILMRGFSGHANLTS